MSGPIQLNTKSCHALVYRLVLNKGQDLHLGCLNECLHNEINFVIFSVTGVKMSFWIK